MAVAEAMTRPVIDLTIETTTRAPRPRIRPFGLPLVSEGPSPKRRRVDGDQPPRKTLKAFLLEHVAPIVTEATRKLPRQSYLVDAIAHESISRLGRAAAIRIRLDESNGYLRPEDLADIARHAKDVVTRLTLLPQYQRQPPQPLQPSLPPPANTGQPFNVTDIFPYNPSSAARYLRTPRPNRGIVHVHPDQAQTQSSESSQWFRLRGRPYITASERGLIASGVRHYLPTEQSDLTHPVVFHVDFTTDEVQRIKEHVSRWMPNNFEPTYVALSEAFVSLHDQLPGILAEVLPDRTQDDIKNFCLDVLSGQVSPDQHRILSIRAQAPDARRREGTNTRVHSLLLARELDGNRGFGHSRQFLNFQAECMQVREDALGLDAEFTNCAGDIATISWVSQDGFVCGTTAHSDRHNQQYNKPGNLLTFSAATNKLRAFPDHRIPRPLVESGENSTAAMRQSQDPWLYSSVVSSDYDEVRGLAYTSSFDKTVKVWKVDDSGTLTNLATWPHEGNVNFVVAAKDGSGRVASAADTPSEAVRIYTVNPLTALVKNAFQALSCTRTDANGSDKWAYFPATMAWGRAPGTQHLLAIGYSPRSLSGDDNDIPEDKRHSGEIMLWDAAAGRRVYVLTATTANVFEIAWHPTQPRFIVATTPCGLNIEHGVRTQIHLFQRDIERTDGAYSEFQKLDCKASDINEVTIMPNSTQHAYITAACTDGRVYVWDTAQGDWPIHVLKHGRPLDEFLVDREGEDTGVKFTAWGLTSDRFYTGGSDGVVKVWNIRKKSNPFLRILLEAPGPISCGSFLEDRSRLAVGDATGRVFVFSLDKTEDTASHAPIPGLGRHVRRPQPYIPHPEPPPPRSNPSVLPETLAAEVSEGAYARQTYLDTGRLTIHPNPTVGAVQGPTYQSTGLYRLDAHRDGDPTAPLLTHYDRLQRASVHAGLGRRRSARRLKSVELSLSAALNERHQANKARDFSIENLSDGELAELVAAGADLSIEDEDWGFTYEDMPAALR